MPLQQSEGRRVGPAPAPPLASRTRGTLSGAAGAWRGCRTNACEQRTQNQNPRGSAQSNTTTKVTTTAAAAATRGKIRSSRNCFQAAALSMTLLRAKLSVAGSTGAFGFKNNNRSSRGQSTGLHASRHPGCKDRGGGAAVARLRTNGATSSASSAERSCGVTDRGRGPSDKQVGEGGGFRARHRE